MPNLARIAQGSCERLVHRNVDGAMFVECQLRRAGPDAEDAESFQLAVKGSRCIERRRCEGRGLHLGDDSFHQPAPDATGHRHGLG